MLGLITLDTAQYLRVRGVDTGELVLDDVRVPARNLVGEIGGFRLAIINAIDLSAGRRARDLLDPQLFTM